MGTVAHDHVFRQPCHIVNRLLSAFGGVLLAEGLGGDHGQHIGQRHNAPAVDQPQQKIEIEMGLNPPDDGPVTILLCHLLFGLVGLFCQRVDLAVRFHKLRDLAADGHVVGLGVQRQIGAEDLGIIGLVHIQPVHPVAGGDIHPFGALKIVIPIPLFTGMLLNEGDGVADLLGRVLLNIILSVTQGRRQLEYGDTVLQFQALGDDAVAHKGAVAGGVALDGAGAQNRRVVIDGHTGFRFRHGADIAGQAIFLSNIDVVYGGILVQQYGYIGGGCFPAQALQGGKAHHDGGHLVFIHQDHFFGELRIVADAPVPPEQIVQQLCHVGYNQVLLRMADAQVFSPQTLGVSVQHHRHCQIVGHPAVAEHCLDVPGFHDESGKNAHNMQPAPVVVHGIRKAPPFPALPDLAVGIQIAQAVFSHFLSHASHLPVFS